MDLIGDLDRLGSSRAKVADTLRGMGIRGVPMSWECCPVAVYLHRLHPGHRFKVANLRVCIDGEGRCTIPPAVTAFITDFDRGEYPDMIDPLHAEQEVPE